MSSSPRADSPSLSPEQIGRAIQFGEQCTAPIVRVPAKRGQDFDVYVESPLGRAALAIATAHVMHVSIDAQAVRRAMQVSNYRVWGDRPIGSRATVTVQRILIRPQTGRDITSLGQQYERFSVGTVPSHGIIEPLRARFGEAVFDRLPDGPFDVVFRTNAGVQAYHVTERMRTTPLYVCNQQAGYR